MQGLRIVNKDGDPPSSDEIEAAHRVANTHKEMKFGMIVQKDALKSVEVEYYPAKQMAITRVRRFQYLYSKVVQPGCKCRTVLFGVQRDFFSSPPGGTKNEIWRAFLSDGTQLATWNSNASLSTPAATNQPVHGWYGGPSVQLYDTNALGGVTPGIVIPLDIPEDACTPTPPLPNPDATAGLAIAWDRTREFKQACSDTFMGRMDAGQVPRTLEMAIKGAHPRSMHATYAQPFEVVSFSNVLTVDDPIHCQRQADITLRYTIQLEDGTEEVRTASYTGTFDLYLDLVEVISQAPGSTTKVSSLTQVYNNYFSQGNFVTWIDQQMLISYWFQPELYGGYNIGGLIPDDGLVLPVSPCMLSQFSGTRISYEISGGTGSPDKRPSEFLEFFTQDYEFITDVSALAAIGFDFTVDEAVLTSSEFPLLTEFRGGNKPVYSSAPHTQLWMDSRFWSGETVIAYPIHYTSATLGDLGMFPSDHDKPFITGIYLTKGYKYTYSYADGKLSFAGTVPVKGVDEDTLRRDFATEDYSLPNFIFKSTRPKTKLQDVDQLYTDQPGAISGDFDPDNITLTGLYDLLQ